MSLDWMPRDNEPKDHALHRDPHWGTEAPCVIYEKKPLTDPQGNVTEGLFVSWITLNNPRQFNSYTTDMVKGVIAGFENASSILILISLPIKSSLQDKSVLSRVAI